MPKHRATILAVALGAGLLASGCQTICREDGSSPRESGANLLSGSEEAAMAEALANFGMGILSEGMPTGDSAAYYARAAELEPDSIRAYVGIATHYARKGERDAAIEALKKCCEINPRSADARLHLAQFCQSFNRMDEALAAALESVELAPNDHRAYLRLASIHLATGKNDSAIEVLERALLKVDNSLSLLRYLGDIHAQSVQSSAPSAAAQHLKQAIFYYEAASQQPHDPLTSAYLHRLGDLLILGQDVQKAAQVFEQMAVYQPHDLQVHKKLALCYMALNEKEKAVLALKEVIEGEPENSEVCYYMGELYEAMDDRENAIKCYELAGEAPSANPLPYLKLAALHIGSDPEKASRTLVEGLKRMPDNIELLSMLARTYLVKHQNVEAINTFERLRELAEADEASPLLDPTLYLDFGVVAQNILLTDKAAAFFEKGLEINPSSVELYVRLAFLLMDKGRNEDSIAIMEKAVSFLPDNPDAHFYLGILNERAGRFEKAVQSFERVAEIARSDPGVVLDSRFFFSYGAALERSGDRAAAEAMLLQVLDLDSESAEAFNYLAYMWAEAGENLDLALEYVNHALDLDPDNAAFVDTLAWILQKQGRHGLALDHIENALYFLPDDPVISEHMGDILMALGRKEEAVEWWTYSLRLDPSNESVAKTLLRSGIDPKQFLGEPKPEGP